MVANTAEIIFQALSEQTKRSPGELSMETRLAEDLMLKSVNRIELAAILEDRFGITISNFDILKPRTLGNLIDMVQSKM